MKTGAKARGVRALPKPRTKAKAKAPAQGRARKVWSGARKKLSVSPLQLALPGIGMTAL